MENFAVLLTSVARRLSEVSNDDSRNGRFLMKRFSLTLASILCVTVLGAAAAAAKDKQIYFRFYALLLLLMHFHHLHSDYL